MGPVYERAAIRIHTQLTSNEPATVVIDLARVTNFLQPLLESIDPSLGERLENVPDTIVLFKEKMLPNITPIASFLSNFGRAIGVLGLALLGYFFYKAHTRENRIEYIKNLGIITSFSSAIVFLTLNTVRDYVISLPTSESGRVLVMQIFSGMTLDLRNVTILLFFLGIIMVVITIVVRRVSKK